jgi:hypothetical protein
MQMDPEKLKRRIDSLYEEYFSNPDLEVYWEITLAPACCAVPCSSDDTIASVRAKPTLIHVVI